NEVTTNPIAGTRPRGNNIAEDNALAKELLADPKEISEHDMLVDLSMQDLSLICESESISVPVYKQIEKYEHVMHIVYEVTGTLMKNKRNIYALNFFIQDGTVSVAYILSAWLTINNIVSTQR